MKSPLPIPSLIAYAFGNMIEKDVSPIRPWTFLTRNLDFDALLHSLNKLCYV